MTKTYLQREEIEDENCDDIRHIPPGPFPPPPPSLYKQTLSVSECKLKSNVTPVCKLGIVYKGVEADTHTKF